MKNNPSTYLEALSLDKNKGIHDEFLLKTIKFNDISEIKAQLPTKKNYNSNIYGNLKHAKNKRVINKSTIIKKNKIPTKIQNDNYNEEYMAKLKDIMKMDLLELIK